MTDQRVRRGGPRATTKPPSAPRRRLIVLAPLVVFGAMAAMFAFALTKGDPSKLPSALIGKPAPALALTAIEGCRMAPARFRC